MAIIRYPAFTGFANPFQELARMRREMDRLFGEIAGRSPLSPLSGVFPALNVTEEGDKYTVCAEIPGIKTESLSISVEGATLTLSGERTPDTPEAASYHRRERRAGRFHKAITLPVEINAEAVKAECRDGVLRLTLPKAEHAKPKKIEVKAE